MTDLTEITYITDYGIRLDWLLNELAPREVGILEESIPSLKWKEQVPKGSESCAVVKKDELAVVLYRVGSKGFSSIKFTDGKPKNAKFDCDGCWGWYEDGVEKLFAHGHEEGDTHDRTVDWYRWVDEKLTIILK